MTPTWMETLFVRVGYLIHVRRAVCQVARIPGESLPRTPAALPRDQPGHSRKCRIYRQPRDRLHQMERTSAKVQPSSGRPPQAQPSILCTSMTFPLVRRTGRAAPLGQPEAGIPGMLYRGTTATSRTDLHGITTSTTTAQIRPGGILSRSRDRGASSILAGRLSPGPPVITSTEATFPRLSISHLLVSRRPFSRAPLTTTRLHLEFTTTRSWPWTLVVRRIRREDSS